MNSESTKWEIWNKNTETITPEETKRMVCYAMGVLMKTVLQNHIFTFYEELHKQLKGGAIGVSAAGDIANLFMIWWDRQLKERCTQEELVLHLYSRYVDDEIAVCDEVQQSADDEEGTEADKRTMNKLKQIANDIHPSIHVKIDVPSDHQNRRLPILDTEQWIEEVEVNGVKKKQILHSHYMKPMANKHVVHRDSGISYQSKINILVADLVRIMCNVSRLCKEEERTRRVQEFMTRMQYSGYSKSERSAVLIKANHKYEKKIEEDTTGERPMYRSKTWNAEERRKEKIAKKTNWYKKGGYDTVFFVDATPDQELANKCREIFKKAELNIKVIEKSGQSVRKALSRSDPFKTKNCKKESCEVCATEDKVNCKHREVVYKISCDGTKENGEKCKNITYIGETSRSIAERFSEHKRALLHESTEQKKKSVFYEHITKEHNQVPQPLKLEIVGSYPGDAMLRQMAEAVMIADEKPVINSKDEWIQNQPRKRNERRNQQT